MTTETRITRSTPLSSPGAREWLKKEMAHALLPSSPSMVAFELDRLWKIEVSSNGTVSLANKAIHGVTDVGGLCDMLYLLTGREMEVSE